LQAHPRRVVILGGGVARWDALSAVLVLLVAQEVVRFVGADALARTLLLLSVVGLLARGRRLLHAELARAVLGHC
jgi:hypothetical protein